MVHKSRLAGPPTPERRDADADVADEREAGRRAIHSALGFWLICDTPKCRRVHSCSGELDHCFDRHWRPLPEEEKEYVRS